MNDPNVPLAAIVSTSVAATLGAGPGVVASVLLDNVLIPIQVRAVVELFPTADPALGFVIVNRQHLQALATLLDVDEGRRANELWLRFDAPLERQRELIAVLQGDQSPLKITTQTHHRDAEIATVRADPTLRASGAGILTASFTAVVGLAALGFVVTLVLGARSRTVEFAVLRAIGSSRLQILRSMVLEWGVVLVIGAVVGALLGRRVARVMLSFLDVTEDGTRVLPPFSLETDWATLGVGIGALVAVVALGLVLSWASALRRATAGELRLTR
ncbi:MAG: FtsX-like permease family protein [Chloroflexi bacterium]|nr:FtsX-like permease family protein [Chloroflexota bacterium]